MQIKIPAVLTTDLRGILFLLQLVNAAVSCSGWMLDAAPGQPGQYDTVHGGFAGL